MRLQRAPATAVPLVVVMVVGVPVPVLWQVVVVAPRSQIGCLSTLSRRRLGMVSPWVRHQMTMVGAQGVGMGGGGVVYARVRC